ncbi:ribonuclease T2 [Cricetibacter osteomyelitidis]|uniref:Ribonuclease T2 n=1 Tax=Cricetibacter osteomyelitidis TaxID=1521931 RepID=A0A4R2SSE5_9PAST|nr:ribonuclease [Cricetibacter osteomyelitidis]TCP93219.1 ribonuclease T2 [Cricetibacter osteomyelitidis]
MSKKQDIKLPPWLVVALLVLGIIYQLFFAPPKNTEYPSLGKQDVSNTIIADYDVKMRDDAIGQNKNAKTDYYMLALSWSPGFCDMQRKQNGNRLPPSSQYQCGTKNQFGWVIHGLWPQNANAKSVSDHPRFCQGDLPPLNENLLKHYLSESPGAKLLQGEWEKHGACAFDSAEQYFEKQRELYRTLVLPKNEMSRSELFKWMKKHNKQLTNRYLRASHNELFICYNKNWQTMDCPKN